MLSNDNGLCVPAKAELSSRAVVTSLLSAEQVEAGSADKSCIYRDKGTAELQHCCYCLQSPGCSTSGGTPGQQVLHESTERFYVGDGDRLFKAYPCPKVSFAARKNPKGSQSFRKMLAVNVRSIKPQNILYKLPAASPVWISDVGLPQNRCLGCPTQRGFLSV